MSGRNLSKQEKYEAKRARRELEAGRRRQGRLVKRISLWAFVGVLVVGAVFGLANLGEVGSGGGAILMDAVAPSDWVKGNAVASVTLIEYSDFQCPACGTYYSLVQQLNEEFGDRIQFVYRHFPLRQIHANAELAARAAEAAGRQGKFWEMHDLIFENQRSWSDQSSAEDVFVSYAETLELNIKQFRSDIDDGEIKGKVSDDYSSGIRSGVDSTPTFFLNGVKIQNPRAYEEFRNVIEQALASNS
ncbi:MAG: thioredoxin domain-containing protein [bacterium]|nr:thioredoxin domain-containing protein [bacterium]